jgi:hypothetical protein
MKLNKLSDIPIGVDFTLYKEEWCVNRYMRVNIGHVNTVLLSCVQTLGDARGSWCELSNFRPVYAKKHY